MRRLFFAAELPESVKERLFSARSEWPDLPAAWTKRENLHVTLVFLGGRAEKEIPAVLELARSAARTTSPFELTVSSVEYGPSDKTPRMIWAAGRAPRELNALKRRLGGEPEDLFHITLARLKPPFARLDEDERPLVDQELSASFAVASLALFDSRPGPRGPLYTRLDRIPLQTKGT